MRLNVTTRGRGRELVLVHGWGMNRAVWSSLLSQLENRHRLTLIELPGHGESDYDPGCSSLESWARASLAAAPREADWVGWSLGGQVAVQAALDAPGRIGRLVLVSTTPRFVQDQDWPHAMTEETLEQFARTLKRNPQQTLARFLSLQVQGDELARETLRLLRQESAKRPPPHPSALEQGLQLLRSTDLRSELGRLTCPSLWLLGDRDSLVPGGTAAELERMSLSNAEIHLIERCSHAPFLSHPDQSLGLMKDFLDV